MHCPCPARSRHARLEGGRGSILLCGSILPFTKRHRLPVEALPALRSPVLRSRRRSVTVHAGPEPEQKDVHMVELQDSSFLFTFDVDRNSLPSAKFEEALIGEQEETRKLKEIIADSEAALKQVTKQLNDKQAQAADLTGQLGKEKELATAQRELLDGQVSKMADLQEQAGDLKIELQAAKERAAGTGVDASALQEALTTEKKARDKLEKEMRELKVTLADREEALVKERQLVAVQNECLDEANEVMKKLEEELEAEKRRAADLEAFGTDVLALQEALTAEKKMRDEISDMLEHEQDLAASQQKLSEGLKKDLKTSAAELQKAEQLQAEKDSLVTDLKEQISVLKEQKPVVAKYVPKKVPESFSNEALKNLIAYSQYAERGRDSTPEEEEGDRMYAEGLVEQWTNENITEEQFFAEYLQLAGKLLTQDHWQQFFETCPNAKSIIVQGLEG